MSKFYTDRSKVKADVGADGLFYIDITDDDVGTIIVSAPTAAEAVSLMLDRVRSCLINSSLQSTG
jgi:hypothetical protein